MGFRIGLDAKDPGTRMVAMDQRTLCRDGILRAADAAAAGIDGSELRRLRASGECHRLLRGWYSVERPVDDATGHRLRTTALVRHLGRGSVRATTRS